MNTGTATRIATGMTTGIATGMVTSMLYVIRMRVFSRVPQRLYATTL
jgi:hypothetical protein